MSKTDLLVSKKMMTFQHLSSSYKFTYAGKSSYAPEKSD
ncbi:hypothetical protein SAMN05444280_13532 [Tangfeifania diversioriginum]|uniref:Uncharacterized protein n=1 Tax=Tangfeifania diversioriginum TaxID=1168035 RepID=A0A1M6MSN1_9BACT|nr:hypothetical protein SAMN05444280_13532 [Tangfeifania diversioriginum]